MAANATSSFRSRRFIPAVPHFKSCAKKMSEHSAKHVVEQACVKLPVQNGTGLRRISVVDSLKNQAFQPSCQLRDPRRCNACVAERLHVGFRRNLLTLSEDWLNPVPFLPVHLLARQGVVLSDSPAGWRDFSACGAEVEAVAGRTPPHSFARASTSSGASW